MDGTGRAALALYSRADAPPLGQRRTESRGQRAHHQRTECRCRGTPEHSSPQQMRSGARISAVYHHTAEGHTHTSARGGEKQNSVKGEPGGRHSSVVGLSSRDMIGLRWRKC